MSETTMNHPSDHDDCPRRNVLLDELRQLAQAKPADTIVRKQLAIALLVARRDARREKHWPRRDALLRELRQLAQAHPSDADVRERLAAALVMTSLSGPEANL